MADETTVPESHRDLTEAPVATLATVGPDGRPQLSAVWFLYEDGRFKVSLNTARQKTRNLRRNPAATLFILDPRGYRYLEVRGDARLDPDPDYELADRVGAKYGGADLRQMDGEGESRVVVTIDVARVNAIDMSGAG
jgi:PPOX class probable F420-dependent enzyme